MFYSCIPAYLTIMLTIFYLIARNRKDLKRTAFIQAILTVLIIVVAAMAFKPGRRMGIHGLDHGWIEPVPYRGYP